MIWSAFLHIYQPSWQKPAVLKKITRQSYWRIVHILEKHPEARITLNINGVLTEQLAQNGFRPLLKALQNLVKEGRIELVGSAKYHTILPLLPKHEIIRQIELNNIANKKYFGKWYNPKGFFPPEMCWGDKMSPILKGMGFEWVILDEIAINPTLDPKGYRESECYDGKDGLHFFFRSRSVSDLFSTAAIKSGDHFLHLAKKMRASDTLITAFDGENLGHHSPHMDNRFEEIIAHPGVKMLTHSELFRICSIHRPVKPKASSWSTRPEDMKKHIPYPLWKYPGNPIHKIQWEIYHQTLRVVSRRQHIEGYAKARAILDQALSSDQFWWASAMPWWGTEEALAGTRLFLKALEALPNGSLRSIRKDIERKLDKLANKLSVWQKTGKADKIKKAFLNHEPYARYFGGEKVK